MKNLLLNEKIKNNLAERKTFLIFVRQLKT